MDNIILLTDSYKLTHAKQYPPKTTHVYSYLEPRVGGRFEEVTWFGLQYLIQKYLTGSVVTRDFIEEAAAVSAAHFGDPTHFNREGWEHILNVHGGRLPIKVMALPEGVTVPEGTPLMAVENTDPKCWWLTNAVETLLTHVWYPSTVATLSREIKKVLKGHLEATGCEDVPGTLSYMLHDFACRGVTSMESAAIGGMAHLINFKGTDTVPALVAARRYYGGSIAVGHSVPASEHSTMTSWGQDGETAAYENMLDTYPDGIVSIVIDSWDAFKAAENILGGALKDKINARNGRTVFRPDSGQPIFVNQHLVDIMGNKFGYRTNQKGFKVLPNNVRILQGDGMSYDSVNDLLNAVRSTGWAAENWVFGMGGGLMQKGLDRDTQRFAFKCSSAVINEVRKDVFKRPSTDPSKNSKRGLLHDGMTEVFRDGQALNTHVWDDVVARAAL